MHQCNAVSTSALGLSKAIYQAFPYADIYAARRRPGGKDARGTVRSPSTQRPPTAPASCSRHAH